MTRVDALVAGYRRELVHRWLLMRGCQLGSVLLAGLFVYLTMILGRADLFYITLSVAAIVHGLSGLVILFYYEVPGVVRALHDPDPALADDAWAAIERLRDELLPRLLDDLNVPRDERPDLLRGLDRAGVVRLTAARARDRWRTIGPIYLAVYLVAITVYLWLVFSWEPEIVY